MPPDHQVQERNSVKVRTVLRQFVRDWADEGAKEREVQYGCLLDALERHVPKTGGRPKIGVAMGDLKLPTTIAVLDDSSHPVKNLPGGQNSKKPRVLTPGRGLSRLPFECARRGYAAQGNEFSYHMLQGCKWVLGRCICLLLFFSLSSHSNNRTIQYLLK